MIKVLIANEHNNYSLNLIKTLTKEKNIDILGIVNKKNDIYGYYECLKPDILIMNIKFYDIFFSDSNNFFDLERKNIILLADKINKLYSYNSNKIYNIIDFDSAQDEISDIIKEMFEKKILISDFQLKQQIQQLLLKMKLHTNEYVGMPYLIDSVICCYRNPSLVLDGLDSIYAEVEKDFEYTITIDNIRWSIDNIFRAYKKMVNIDDLCNIFDYYDIGKNLTPKYFISLAIEYLDKLNN